MSDQPTIHEIGIIMNGVTGRMGKNQHLLRSILPIMRQGGVKISEHEVIMPKPVLVGRNATKLEQLSDESGIKEWTTDLESVLDGDKYQIYFDAQRTDLRVESVIKAVAAGKHIYCEKPSAVSTREAVELYQVADKAGVKHGVVQDKLWLPGLVKLRQLRDQDFFGDIFAVKGDFGYWVFEGIRYRRRGPRGTIAKKMAAG
jgi:predicted dehydrogenase